MVIGVELGRASVWNASIGLVGVVFVVHDGCVGSLRFICTEIAMRVFRWSVLLWLELFVPRADRAPAVCGKVSSGGGDELGCGEEQSGGVQFFVW